MIIIYKNRAKLSNWDIYYKKKEIEIIENEELYFSPIDYPYEEFKDGIYHIYFAYNIAETVTGVSDLQITVTDGDQPIGVTAEHCTNTGMAAQGNIYVIHVKLAKYYYAQGTSCNRIVRVTGGWEAEGLPIDIPISTQVIQIGCEETNARRQKKTRLILVSFFF